MSNQVKHTATWYETFESFVNRGDVVDNFRDMSKLRFIAHQTMHYISLVVPPVIAAFETFGFFYYLYKKYRQHGRAESQPISKPKKMRLGVKILLGLGITVTSLVALAVAPMTAVALITTSSILKSAKSGFSFYRQNKKQKRFTKHLKELQDNMSLMALQIERLHAEQNQLERAMKSHKFDGDHDLNERYKNINSTIEQKVHQYHQYKAQAHLLEHKIQHIKVKKRQSIETVVTFTYAAATLITMMVFPPAGMVMAAVGLALTTSYIGIKAISYGARKLYQNRHRIIKAITKPFKKVFSSLKNVFSPKKSHANITSSNHVAVANSIDSSAEHVASTESIESQSATQVNKAVQNKNSDDSQRDTAVKTKDTKLSSAADNKIYPIRATHIEKVLAKEITHDWSASTVLIRGKCAIDWACKVIDAKKRLFDIVWMHHDSKQLYHYHWHIADPELAEKIFQFVTANKPLTLDLFENQYVVDLLTSADNKIYKAVNAQAHFDSKNELMVVHSDPFQSIDISTQTATTFAAKQHLQQDDEGEGGATAVAHVALSASKVPHDMPIDKCVISSDKDLEHLGMFGTNEHAVVSPQQQSSSSQKKIDDSDVSDVSSITETMQEV